jgi:NAD(P)-dependent dehydrogenase (short-subunit alcohol dehydrogenase family)
MSQSVVFITGTSSGIGKALAEVLVSGGWRVFGSSRQGAENAPAGVEQLKLDVCDDKSVKAAVADVIQKAGRIDALINNAGVVQLGAVEELTIDEVKANFETNFFGMMRVTQAVLPQMRAQGSGQIINIGSVAGVSASPYLSSYCATKYAMEAFNTSLRYELKPFNIHVSLLGPSFVKSGIPQREGKSVKRVAAYDPAREMVYARFDSELMKGEETLAIAQEMAKVVGAKKPRARYQIGKGARMLSWMKTMVPEALSDTVALKYWGLDKAFAQPKVMPEVASNRS